MTRNQALIGIVVLLMLGLAVAPALMPSGGSAAGVAPQPSGGPQLTVGNPSAALHVADTGVPIEEGGFLTNDREFLVFNGYTTWGGAYEVVLNNSQVYASQFELVIYSLVTFTKSITITINESGASNTQSTTVQPGIADVVTVALQPDNSWTQVYLFVDYTEQGYSVAVPISFLPNSITQVGGLDLLALGIISECLISLALAVSSAYAAMRRAIWAPKFSLLIWGHVILLTIVGVVILDFQFVDQVFAGWSPLFYAFFLFPIFFFFSLSYFNRAPKAELLQANTPLAGRLSFNRWTLRIARDRRGQWSIVGPKWRDFFARLWGHGVPLTAVESSITSPEPFISDIVNRKIRSRLDVFKRVRRPSPSKASPLDDFDVIPAAIDGRAATGKDDPPVKMLWTPTGHPVDVTWPRLTMHRTVKVAPTVDRDGNVTAEHYKQRLSMPHYTEGHANLVLHSLHYRSAMSVVSGWRSVEDLALILSDTTLDLEALKSSFETSVANTAKAHLLARASLLGQSAEDISMEDAAAEAERDRNAPLDALVGRGLIPPSLKPNAPPKHEDKSGRGNQ